MPSTGTPALEHRRVAVRRAGSETLFGPPDRMIPTGRRARDLRERRIERQNLGVDRELAQAARDQLGELRAEVEDDDGLDASRPEGDRAIIRCASRRTTISCRFCRPN